MTGKLSKKRDTTEILTKKYSRKNRKLKKNSKINTGGGSISSEIKENKL